MIAHLKDEPESDIVAAMLTDELMETRGMLRTEADRQVLDLRRTFRAALPVGQAHNIIHADVAFRVWLREKVSEDVKLGRGTNFTIDIIPGVQPAFLSFAGEEAQAKYNYGVVIGVGASLVIYWYAEWLKTLPPREQRRRARRKSK